MAVVTLGGIQPLSNLPQTLGELRRNLNFPKSGCALAASKTRCATISSPACAPSGPVFPGIVGYDDTVVPQIVNAILSRHNFILLGLRGQAKSRILRALTTLLDPQMPYLPAARSTTIPMLRSALAAASCWPTNPDGARIAYLTPDERYVEKLATPDVTIADLIGDIDPIKAAKGGHELGSEMTVHYGLLPRANRGIFAVNELPDLAGKIQVGLFNIMQEGDVQIKGYPVRLPLDVALVFTANPEDYTARGKIVTPLKDRIGSEIRTHYPATVEEGIAITAQEAWIERNGHQLQIPDFIREVIEHTAFVAREDKRVDKRSGVSQRLPISAMENVISNAERRAIRSGEKLVVPRVGDIYAAMPAITGKLELEYEGELKGADNVVARHHPRRGCPHLRSLFSRQQQHEPGGAVVRSGRRNPVARFGQRAGDAAQAARNPGTARQAERASDSAAKSRPRCWCRPRSSSSKACTRTSASAAARSACSPPARSSLAAKNRMCGKRTTKARLPPATQAVQLEASS